MKFIYSAKDKRSKDGTILKYVIRNQTGKIAKQCVNELKINKFYNIFIKNFDNDLIDFYFLNYFFDKIYSTIAKIHIHKWNKTNSKIIQPEIIEIPNFEFIEIFEKFWPEKELNYKINNFYFENNGMKISYFRYLLMRLLDFVKNINFYFTGKFKNIKNINQIYTDPMIAISYREGLDKNKRSDIFWYNENQINPENIIIYFNNFFSMNRYEGFNSLLKSIEKYRFKWVSLFRINYKYKKNYFQKNQRIISNDFKNLFNQLYTFNNTNNNFKLNRYFFINLFRKINYWYNFTYIYNIKILYDPIEFSGDLILQNIALKLNNGCSFRHQRSLIVGKESHFGFYPQNIFFAWGKNSCNKFFENTNITENLIISGHPYRQKNIRLYTG